MIVVFGGATLLFHNEAFIKWKPTAVNWTLMLVFFGISRVEKAPFVRRMLQKTLDVPEAVWWRLNNLWILYFFGVGASNALVAYYFSTNAWVNFKLFGLLGLTLLFVFGQAVYLSKHLNQP